MQAFSPAQAKEYKAKQIPQWLLNAVNDLLVEKYGNGRHIHIKKDDVINRALAEAAKFGVDINRRGIIDFGYLDFESVYEARGWKVTYHSPDYTESFDQYYEFVAKD
jgi:hypothetical protein